ncbi:hypothetical protein NHH03_05435 [Stieleria sp. TO1_6]|uniref:hypothetical protein n=1 Tax=Stieleria tagensis TaxID=2956795 RepID=UPI00209B9A06|nr:hypothetical protein [Stieleria tagensis]MCO8121171.1 hypothetical protein [Stieleria tagensis]
MFQFSIFKALLATLYFAVVFGLTNLIGLDWVCILHVWILHFLALCVLPIAAMEYRGHRRRFSIAALIVEVVYMTMIYLDGFRGELVVTSLFAFCLAFFAGVTTAAAYNAIKRPAESDKASGMIKLVSRGLEIVLPAQTPGTPGEPTERKQQA